DRTRLVWRLIQHRGEAEELALLRLIDHYLLLIFINGSEADLAGNHNVGPAARITYLVDALPRSELLDLNLSRQNGGLFIVEQSEKRNFPQCLRIACHELTS